MKEGKGTPGPEIIPELEPQKGDIVLRGKKTLDAFLSTALDYTLRTNLVDTVVVVGFHTNWSYPVGWIRQPRATASKRTGWAAILRGRPHPYRCGGNAR